MERLRPRPVVCLAVLPQVFRIKNESFTRFFQKIADSQGSALSRSPQRAEYQYYSSFAKLFSKKSGL